MTEVKAAVPFVGVEEEKWENMADMGYSKYDISSHGRVRNKNTWRILKQNIRRKYSRVVLSHDDKRIPPRLMLVHRLVAIKFILNLENKLTVDHIDRDTHNNYVLNLRWATTAEQVANKTKPDKVNGRAVIRYSIDGSKQRYISLIEAARQNKCFAQNISNVCYTDDFYNGYKWRYEDMLPIEGETWKKNTRSDIEEVWASNKGRVYIIRSRRACIGHETVEKYRLISMKDKDGNYIKILAHRLIAETYYGPSNLFVNHKDGNRQNNNLENLEYVTASQNAQHAHDTGLIKNGHRSVIQYDIKGNEVNKFESLIDMERKTGFPYTDIQKVCNHDIYHHTSHGFLWKFADDKYDIKETIKYIDDKKYQIVRYSLDGKELGRFPSARQATKAMKIGKDALSQAIRTGIQIVCNSRWKRVKFGTNEPFGRQVFGGQVI